MSQYSCLNIITSGKTSHVHTLHSCSLSFLTVTYRDRSDRARMKKYYDTASELLNVLEIVKGKIKSRIMLFVWFSPTLICLHCHTRLEFLTTGSVDDISKLSVLPLAEVILFHASSSFGCLHLRTPVVWSR